MALFAALNDTEQPIFLLAALIVPEAVWRPLKRDPEQATTRHIPTTAIGHVARGTGSSARLDAVGMTVTRTPLTPSSIIVGRTSRTPGMAA